MSFTKVIYMDSNYVFLYLQTLNLLISINAPEQGLANIFCKGPDHKYVSFSGPHDFCPNYSILPL